jgi:hypothetical protein
MDEARAFLDTFGIGFITCVLISLVVITILLLFDETRFSKGDKCDVFWCTKEYVEDHSHKNYSRFISVTTPVVGIVIFGTTIIYAVGSLSKYLIEVLK